MVMKISYENADQQVQTKEFPIKLTAEEYVPPMDDGEGSMEENSGPHIPVLPIVLAAGAVVIVLVVVILVRKKKAAQLLNTTGGSWDDWDDAGSSGEE